MALRPQLKFLSAELLERIVAEARDILCRLGTKVQNPRVLEMLAATWCQGGFRKKPGAVHGFPAGQLP